MMKKGISITLEEDILKKIDEKRSRISRSSFIEMILEENLDEY